MLYILRTAASTFQYATNVVFHFLTANYFQKQILDPSLSSRTMKNIVILGGSYAGVSTAHRILKQGAKTGPFKITLVSPNTDFYWNVAAPRGLIPGQLTDDKLFQPIAPGFTHYPAGQFEFILGSAESIDTKAKQVEISGAIGNRILDYDFLILGTGSNTMGDVPFKSMGSTEATKDALHDFQARVMKAKKIVIAGSGTTGVEIAGELGFEYGQDKEIILISSGPTVLEGRPASVSKTATKQLQNLKVDIKVQTKVNGSAQMPDGRQELILSGGDKLIADMYIPTFGVKPNSSYVPSKFLDPNGFVKVDEFLKVKGAEDVWAIGDVSDAEPSQIMFCENQSTHLAKNMTLILSGKTPLPYKVSTTDMMGLQVGRKAGTGHFGSWQIPGFVVSMLRKTLFVERLGPTVDGSWFK